LEVCSATANGREGTSKKILSIRSLASWGGWFKSGWWLASSLIVLNKPVESGFLVASDLQARRLEFLPVFLVFLVVNAVSCAKTW
jgi:hypothetical protein